MKRSTTRLISVAVLLLAGAGACRAQQSSGACSSYFVMYLADQNLLGPGLFLAFDTDQAKWLEKESKKKYPGLCFDAEKATYVMVTIRWAEERQQTVTRTKRAYTTGPVPAVIGLSASGPGRPAQPIWGTHLATFVTTWQEKETKAVNEPHALLLTFRTKDRRPLSDATELEPGPFTKVQKVGRKASKDALKLTFEILEPLLKARAK